MKRPTGVCRDFFTCFEHYWLRGALLHDDGVTFRLLPPTSIFGCREHAAATIRTVRRGKFHHVSVYQISTLTPAPYAA